MINLNKQKEEIIDLYLNNNYTFADIGRKYNCSYQTIERRIKKWKIQKKEYGGKSKDLRGKKFGRLFVIKEKFRNSNGIYWLCKCDCGKEKVVVSRSLIHSYTLSCGCILKELHWKGIGELSGTYWHKIERGAKSRNIKFSITKEYIWELFLKQDRKCALTGEEIVLVKDYTKNRKLHTASLDRINPKYGYIKDNVWWVHRDINILKNNWENKEFIEMCCKVADYERFKKFNQ